MSAEQRLAADRANRNAARRVFTTRLDRIKADLDAQGIGSRMAESVAGEVSGAVETGLDVARERKGVIAGTIGALLLWIFRQPLISAATALFGRFAGNRDEATEDECSDESE